MGIKIFPPGNQWKPIMVFEEDNEADHNYRNKTERLGMTKSINKFVSRCKQVVRETQIKSEF